MPVVLNELTSLFCWMTISATCCALSFFSPLSLLASSSRGIIVEGSETGSMNEFIVAKARKSRRHGGRNVTDVKTRDRFSKARVARVTRTNERVTFAFPSRRISKFRVTTGTRDDVSAADAELCAQSSSHAHLARLDGATAIDASCVRLFPSSSPSADKSIRIFARARFSETTTSHLPCSSR